MKAILVALVLAACAFAYAISSAWADDGGSAAAPAAPSQSAPAAQPAQQNGDRPREDCPERDGSGSSGSSGSSDSDLQF